MTVLLEIFVLNAQKKSYNTGGFLHLIAMRIQNLMDEPYVLMGQ